MSTISSIVTAIVAVMLVTVVDFNSQIMLVLFITILPVTTVITNVNIIIAIIITFMCMMITTLMTMMMVNCHCDCCCYSLSFHCQSRALRHGSLHLRGLAEACPGVAEPAR